MLVLRLRCAAFAYALTLAGCAYDPAFELTCDDEGAVDGDRECRGGVWVSGEPGADGGADTSTGGEDASGGSDVGAPDATTPDGGGSDVGGDAGGDATTCMPETDGEFCTRLVKTCGEVTDVDNCGDSRTADCGMCTAPATCGGGGTPNVCACPGQSDQAFCDAYGAVCGPLTQVDECGQMRTVTCGACMNPEQCGAVTPNQCDCPDDQAVCVSIGKQCGVVDVTGQCGNKTMVDCGGCQANASCSANLCECDAGFMPDGGGNCVDVDECATGADDCGANALCMNVPGGFMCACDAGYAGDGITCTDVDECMAGTDNCAVNATCTNVPGSFMCACDAGYMGNGITCADVDECAGNTDDCDPNATCSNEPGTFSCACNMGFTGTGTTCADIDECATGADNCDANASCTNSPPGSFTCTCDAGYMGTGVSCADIDECTLGTDTCDANADCTNTDGGFTCACKAGFTGDGMTCAPLVTFVTRVVQREITLANGDSTQQDTFPGAVDPANSIVFASRRMPVGLNLDDSAVDVFLSGASTITLERNGSVGDITVVATVVEFDPVKVSVQSGTFSGEETKSINAVDPARSFILFSYRSSSGHNDKDDEMMSAHFSANDAIQFGRAATNGAMSGHWYVATALNDEFTVDHLSGGLAGVDTTDLSVPAVDPAKSFIVYSHRTTQSSSEGRRGHVSCELESATNVRCDREHNGDDITELHVQVVELGGGQVRRGTGTLTGGDGMVGATLMPAASAKAMAWIGMTGSIGAVQTTQQNSTDMGESYVTAALRTSNSLVSIDRDDTGTDATVTWEVVEWP